MMLVALDVQYVDPKAWAAAIVFDRWSAGHPRAIHLVELDDVAPYESGSFFKRELPCLLRVLAELSTREPIDAILVDSYVDLALGRPGLGRHLYDRLLIPAPVIGVAKTHFADAPAAEVLRGTSTRPLYVTVAGMPLQHAAEHVQAMHGEFRIPTMLKQADALARQGALAYRIDRDGLAAARS